MSLPDGEFEMLQKYADGQIIEKEDEHFLDDMATVGMVRFGMIEENGKLLGTASLTPMAKAALKTELRIRSPYKKLFRFLSTEGF